MVAFSNFKATGFTGRNANEFLNSHNLFHTNILSSSCHLCVYILTVLWLRKYVVFYFSRDNTVEVSRDFVGEVLSY